MTKYGFNTIHYELHYEMRPYCLDRRGAQYKRLMTEVLACHRYDNKFDNKYRLLAVFVSQ
jgi:hypothetical protein